MLYLYFVPFIGFQIKYDDDDICLSVCPMCLPLSRERKVAVSSNQVSARKFD